MSYKLSFTAQELEKLYAKQSLEIAQEVSVSDDSFIVVNVDFAIADGSEIKFKSPADCSQVIGLRVWYKSGDDTAFQDFNFADAHGNNVGDIDHLFATNAVVKVLLDVAGSMAFVQNADTNAYIERTFIKSINGVTPDPDTGDVALEVSGGGGGKGGLYVTKNKIPLDNYSSVRFTGTIYRDYTYKNRIGIVVLSSIGNNTEDNAAANFCANTGTTNFDDQSVLNISSLTGSYYIGFYINSSDSKYIELKKLRLE